MPLYGLEGFSQSIPSGLEGIAGSIVIPARRSRESAMAKNFRKAEYRGRLLLDPQVYLTQLEPSQCRKVCVRLASYPWFDTGDLYLQRTARSKTKNKWAQKAVELIHKYWTGVLPHGEKIDSAQTNIVVTQRNMGCEAIILGAPLTVNPTTDLSVELEWLDRGLIRAQKENLLRLPVYASVVLSDRVLSGLEATENSLLDTIIDQVSAREVDGVYLVIELSNVMGHYAGDRQVVGALMKLVGGFKRAGMGHVIVNYATVAGLLALAAGANTLCLGWNQSERRLRLDKLADDDGGPQWPTYYSHPFASEVTLSMDMEKVVGAGLLDEFADETDFSEVMLAALRAGKSPSQIAEWPVERGQTTTAKQHFYSAMAREVERIEKLGSDEKLAYAQRWTDRAAELVDMLRSRVKHYEMEELHARTETGHQNAWSRAVAAYIANK